jgi:hypothetical protein
MMYWSWLIREVARTLLVKVMSVSQSWLMTVSVFRVPLDEGGGMIKAVHGGVPVDNSGGIQV